MTNWFNRYSIYLVFLIAGVLTVASYFLPVSDTVMNEAATRWRMVSTVGMVTLIGGAALLFLQGLSTFKAGLSVAYKWFAAGMILLAVALLQWPVLVLLNAQDSFWVLSGIVILPFIVSCTFIYKGIRQFAKLLEIDSWLTSWPATLTASASFTVLSGGAAYVFLRTTLAPPAISDDMYLYTATVAWSASFVSLAWLLVIKVRDAIGVSYKKPLSWLVVALGAITFSAFHEYITSYFVSDNDWYLATGAISWPFIVSGVLLAIAGYMFNEEWIGVVSTASEDSVQLDYAYINSIANIAQLASRPTAIDRMLDGLHRATTEVKSGGSLTDEDRIQLLDTYRQLEDYLVMSDPLKKFTKEQLRVSLAPVFRSRVESLF